MDWEEDKAGSGNIDKHTDQRVFHLLVTLLNRKWTSLNEASNNVEIPYMDLVKYL